MASGALHGVRILEFSQIVSLPFGGCILSDLCADVIKVEPLTGDPHRNRGAVVPQQGKRFLSLNRGKRSLALDLGRAEGRELIYRLMPQIDVATSNYRHGVAERLGIDYETLKRYRADLVFCEVTGFGSRGAMSERAGTDIVANAYSGLMAGDRKVDDEGVPANITALSLADYAAGFSAAVGVCAALHHRALTGEGQRVETSLLAAALAIQDTAVMREPVHDAVIRDPMMDRSARREAAGRATRSCSGSTIADGGRAARRSAATTAAIRRRTASSSWALSRPRGGTARDGCSGSRTTAATPRTSTPAIPGTSSGRLGSSPRSLSGCVRALSRSGSRRSPRRACRWRH